jgi:multicomponent Na+:H+ antiporter subunit F
MTLVTIPNLFSAETLQVLLVVAVALAMVRLVRGPSIADRVIALEVTGASVVGLLAISAVSQDRTTYIDVSLAVALVAFITVLGFATYMERVPHDD